eukprot:16318-Heterococcus_DN1.PRE.1
MPVALACLSQTKTLSSTVSTLLTTPTRVKEVAEICPLHHQPQYEMAVPTMQLSTRDGQHRQHSEEVGVQHAAAHCGHLDAADDLLAVGHLYADDHKVERHPVVSCKACQSELSIALHVAQCAQA